MLLTVSREISWNYLDTPFSFEYCLKDSAGSNWKEMPGAVSYCSK